jgi:hypothetical protein
MSAIVNGPRLKPQLKVTFETFMIKIDPITLAKPKAYCKSTDSELIPAFNHICASRFQVSIMLNPEMRPFLNSELIRANAGETDARLSQFTEGLDKFS